MGARPTHQLLIGRRPQLFFDWLCSPTYGVPPVAARLPVGDRTAARPESAATGSRDRTRTLDVPAARASLPLAHNRRDSVDCTLRVVGRRDLPTVIGELRCVAPSPAPKSSELPGSRPATSWTRLPFGIRSTWAACCSSDPSRLGSPSCARPHRCLRLRG